MVSAKTPLDKILASPWRVMSGWSLGKVVKLKIVAELTLVGSMREIVRVVMRRRKLLMERTAAILVGVLAIF